MTTRSLMFFAVFFAMATMLHGQSGTPQPTPVPTPQPTPVQVAPQMSMVDRMKLRREAAATLSPAEQARYQNLIAARYIDPIYRKPTKEELSAVGVDASLSLRYKSLLSMPKTGVFKLVADHGCDQKTAVVSATDECVKYSMPGAANSYSFRAATYRLRRLGDISIRGTSIFVPGVFMHGILVDLGDANVESLELGSPGVGTLADLRAATTTAEATKIGARIARGFEKDGYRYSGAVDMKPNTTYALRSIAYRGNVMRAVEGATYNEMGRDKRRDIVVVFRIVEIGSDGSATIIWRELNNAESPHLKYEK